MREGESERESETMRLYTTNDRVSEHRNCTHARTGSCTNTYCTHTSAVKHTITLFQWAAYSIACSEVSTHASEIQTFKYSGQQ